jgi:hypothetical protein
MLKQGRSLPRSREFTSERLHCPRRHSRAVGDTRAGCRAAPGSWPCIIDAIAAAQQLLLIHLLLHLPISPDNVHSFAFPLPSHQPQPTLPASSSATCYQSGQVHGQAVSCLFLVLLCLCNFTSLDRVLPPPAYIDHKARSLWPLGSPSPGPWSLIYFFLYHKHQNIQKAYFAFC